MSKLNLIEIDPETGIVSMRIKKTVIDEQGNEHEIGRPHSGFHRIRLPPGVSVDDVKAAINAHLQAEGVSPISEDALAIVESHRAVAHTPEKIGQYRAMMDHAAAAAKNGGALK